MEAGAKIGLGGGCHWCTEAVFQSLKGVNKVDQGYIASTGTNNSFSEAVIVHYDPELISLLKLIEIHLYTHNSTSDHSFRKKYRSAIYHFTPEDAARTEDILKKLQHQFEQTIVTRPLPFGRFRASRESILNYYRKHPEAPFCKRYIVPKLDFTRQKFTADFERDPS